MDEIPHNEAKIELRLVSEKNNSPNSILRCTSSEAK